jgi:hypothetical protein
MQIQKRNAIMKSERLNLLKMMAERLERLNVDSKWARRASGTRGGVIRAIEQIQQGISPSQDAVDQLISTSMDILAKAARDIPDTVTPDESDSRES